jgi:hypothetical protein
MLDTLVLQELNVLEPAAAEYPMLLWILLRTRVARAELFGQGGAAQAEKRPLVHQISHEAVAGEPVGDHGPRLLEWRVTWARLL